MSESESAESENESEQMGSDYGFFDCLYCLYYYFFGCLSSEVMESDDEVRVSDDEEEVSGCGFFDCLCYLCGCL